MKPLKIISGGQTGADQGALVGAKRVGIPTGGWMPRGYLTEAGPCPALQEVYSVQEHPSPLYPPRTKQNVKDADGTVWVGDLDDGLDSRGFRCTLRATEYFSKLILVNPTHLELRRWVTDYGIKVLNVAGPRASRDKLAHRRAAELIIAAFGDEQ